MNANANIRVLVVGPLFEYTISLCHVALAVLRYDLEDHTSLHGRQSMYNDVQRNAVCAIQLHCHVVIITYLKKMLIALCVQLLLEKEGQELFSECFFRQVGHQFHSHEFQGQVNARLTTSVQFLLPNL